MALSPLELQFLTEEGMTDITIVRVVRDLNGYPMVLIEATGPDEVTRYRGWLKEGESVRDIQWNEVSGMGHIYELRLLTKPGPAIGTGYQWQEVTSPEAVIHLIRAGWEWVDGGCEGSPLCDDCVRILEVLAEE